MMQFDEHLVHLGGRRLLADPSPPVELFVQFVQEPSTGSCFVTNDEECQTAQDRPDQNGFWGHFHLADFKD